MLSKESYDQGLVKETRGTMDNQLFQQALPAIAFAGSIDTPGYANSGAGEELLDEAWMNMSDSPNNVLNWFANGFGELPETLPFPMTQVLDAALLARFRNVSSDTPCSSDLDEVFDGTSKSCQMVRESSVLAWLMSSEWTVPTSICYSDDDSFATAMNVPEDLFDEDHISKSQLLLGGLIEVRGDHTEALLLCAISTSFFYSTNGASSGDGPSVITALTDGEQAICDAGKGDDDDDGDTSSAACWSWQCLVFTLLSSGLAVIVL